MHSCPRTFAQEIAAAALAYLPDTFDRDAVAYRAMCTTLHAGFGYRLDRITDLEAIELVQLDHGGFTTYGRYFGRTAEKLFALRAYDVNDRAVYVYVRAASRAVLRDALGRLFPTLRVPR